MQSVFQEAELSFWTRFFQNEFLHKAYTNKPSTNRSYWRFLPGLDQTTNKFKQYQQVLKKARNEIEALPRLYTDGDHYDTAAKHLDDLRTYAEQIIAKREYDIEKYDTLWNTFKESLPMTYKTTKNHKQVLELWRGIRDTIVAKRKDLSTSRVAVFCDTVTCSIGYVFAVLISVLCSGGFAYAFYPQRDPVQLILCGYFFTVMLRLMGGCCFLRFANGIFSWGMRTLRIFLTMIFAYHGFSVLLERDLQPVELVLLTAAVFTLYEGLRFYRKAARTIIVCVMFALKFSLAVKLTFVLLEQFQIWYPREFEQYVGVYTHSPSESYPSIHFLRAFTVVMLYITFRFL